MSGICETSSHSESHLRLPHGFLGKLGKDEGVSWQGNGFFRWIVSLKKHDFHSVQISKKLFSEVSTRNMFFFFSFLLKYCLYWFLEFSPFSPFCSSQPKGQDFSRKSSPWNWKKIRLSQPVRSACSVRLSPRVQWEDGWGHPDVWEKKKL